MMAVVLCRFPRGEEEKREERAMLSAHAFKHDRRALVSPPHLITLEGPSYRTYGDGVGWKS